VANRPSRCSRSRPPTRSRSASVTGSASRQLLLSVKACASIQRCVPNNPTARPRRVSLTREQRPLALVVCQRSTRLAKVARRWSPRIIVVPRQRRVSRGIMGTKGPAAATLAIWQLLLISGYTLLHLVRTLGRLILGLINACRCFDKAFTASSYKPEVQINVRTM